ncbi:hypothetical protein AVEN_180928-1 [Araneus ventricosus]|uniref:ATP-dependent DNA helicase n=1 Tax=Araneus ventricosus TaxID=182803 RepID=A0A4Y2FHG4_ARAVE|nr:hypothetical protein AVEN_180928-1 [Araneus ventricosus]
MSHKSAFEALDVTLKDTKLNNNRMGGIAMVLAGDFRKTLLVITRGTRSDERQMCLKSSYLWNSIQTLGLTTIRRVHLNGDPSAQQFADTLLQLGNGAITPDNQDGCIAMQRIGRIVKTQQELKEVVFPNVSQNFFDHSWLCQRAILAQNEDISVMNRQLLQELPGSIQVDISIDTTCDTNEVVIYPAGFLNTFEPSGVPSHTLELNIGAPNASRDLHSPSICN